MKTILKGHAFYSVGSLQRNLHADGIFCLQKKKKIFYMTWWKLIRSWNKWLKPGFATFKPES